MKEDQEKAAKKNQSPKVETRLGRLLTLALKTYMLDHHLTNESEILRSALGQLLEREGYLIRVGEEPGEYRVVEKPSDDRTTPRKKIGFRDTLRSEPMLTAAITALVSGAQRARAD